MRERLLGGNRWVWRAAALTGGFMALLIAFQMLKPRDVLLGTTSTRALQPITFQTLEDRLCVPDVPIPGGTGRVEMILSTAVPQPGLELELRAPGKVIKARDPGPGAPGQQNYVIALPEKWPDSADNVAGQVCVKPTGTPFTLLGANAGPTDRPAMLNGKPVGSRLALWFRAPADEKRSYLAQLPQILERVSHFRPGVVGAWTYWLWLLTLPLLWLAGLRLVARGGASTARRTMVTVGVIAFCNFAAWALITPPFDAPDEQEHFTYVQDIAVAHVDPHQGAPDQILAPRTSLAMDATRVFTYFAVPEGRPPWTQVDEDRWNRAWEGTNPKPTTRPPGIASPAATQLPPFLGPLAPASYGLLAPGYYTVASPAYLVASGGSPWTQLTAVRLTSALLGALTAMLAALIVLELLPGRLGVAAGAGLLVAFQPMFAFISGAANSDNGVNTMAALVLFLVIRALRRGLTVPLGLALGVALVVMPMMKTTGYAFYAVAAVGLAGVLWRARRAFRWRPWAALAGSFLLLQTIWVGIVRSQIGPPPNTLFSANPDTVRADLPAQLSYTWQILFPKLPFMTDLNPFPWPDAARHLWLERVWGSFGWLSHLFPGWVYTLIFLVLVGVAIAGVLSLVTNLSAARARTAEIVLLVAAPVLVLFAVHAGLVSLSPRTALPEQGRYLFPAITALAALAIGACAVFGRRLLPVLTAVLVALMMGMGLAGQLLWLTSAYA